MTSPTLLDVQNLKVHFRVTTQSHLFWSTKGSVKAVDGISFQVNEGETLGVVGESGCGKSTLARALIGLVPSNEGNILYKGSAIEHNSAEQWKTVRKEIQMIFQDPLASLNPRMTVGDIIAEPLRSYYPALSSNDIKQQVYAIMEKVGLLQNVINRYPHEFSGGQCQRIGIARALILKPKLLICDEPVSALDVSIQAQVINLLQDLQQEMKLSLLFIAHDLTVVKHISDRVMVMYLGNMMELANKHTLFDKPQHPYTQALLSAVPIADPIKERAKTIQLLEGDLPSPLDPPSGCVFQTRCLHAKAQCQAVKPKPFDIGQQIVACHLVTQ